MGGAAGAGASNGSQREPGGDHRTLTRFPDIPPSLSASPSSASHEPLPSARELLEIVAFFPQGISEKNLEWLFPTISDRKNIFDNFCILSLTYRSNDFITMLAPIRDYLTPKDPKSSPLLCAIKDNYSSRLSVLVDPSAPGFEESGWIVSEDVNVEHLLDVFMSIDPNAGDIWDACYHFMDHLYWHKPRRTLLGSKIEALSDEHPFKPKCLSILSGLFGELGNYAENKRLLSHALKLERQRGNDSLVAGALRDLSDVNRLLGFYEEGIQQAKEGLEIFERLGEVSGQARCLNRLAWLFLDDEQVDAAKDAASRAVDLVQEKGEEHLLCQLHDILGCIWQSKGETEKAVHHFKTALDISTPFNWHGTQFWVHYALASLFRGECKFDDANAHVEQAKSHAVDNPYHLGRAIETQAQVWYRQGRLEDAKSETLRAIEVYEKVGATKDGEDCRDLLRKIEQAMEGHLTSVDSGSDGEFLGMIPCPASANTPR